MITSYREGKEASEMCLSALGGVVSYLKDLFLDKEILAQRRIHAYSPATFDSPHLVLDSKTIKNLELFENTVDGKVCQLPYTYIRGESFIHINSESLYHQADGTLLQVLDHCSTPFGKRMFRRWLTMPLKQIHEIEERQNAILDLNGGKECSAALQEAVTSTLKGSCVSGLLFFSSHPSHACTIFRIARFGANYITHSRLLGYSHQFPAST